MCQKRKPLSAFGKDCTRPDGHLYRCRPCQRIMIMGEERENYKTGPKPIPLADRFWKKVVKTKKCWKWIGSKAHRGYGKIALNGKFLPAPRASWLLHNGEIPGGLFVLHKCDNPECTNPEHLFLGTQKDNMRDMLKKNRGRWKRP